MSGVPAVATLVGAMLIGGCGNHPASTGPSPVSGPPVTTAILLAAGDVGECGFGTGDTGLLLDRLPGTLLVLGDAAYMHGSFADFRDCYHPGWGRHLDRTRPVPGNHDYETAGASGYYDYFGILAGARGQGYYAFTAGPWRIIALNSEIPMAAGSAQHQWLRDELLNHPALCTLAYWHRPLYSSGPNGDNSDTRPLWATLVQSGAEVVLNGHDHMYERFDPQDAEGRLDVVNGLRQFTVGTGGARLATPRAPRPNSRVRSGASYGVLQLTLQATAYSWAFKGVDQAFSDSGAGTCR